MAQLNFYVPDDVETSIRREAKARRKTISAYLSEVVKEHILHDKWRKDFFTKIVGKWRGKFPAIEKLNFEERDEL